MLLYIVGFLVLFLPRAEYPTVVLFTLLPSGLALWLGPLALLGSGSKRKPYDPATLFNLGLFYFSIKGISLSWGERPSFLTWMTYDVIHEQYLLVALYTTAGLLMWNAGYQFVLRSRADAESEGQADKNAGSVADLGVTDWPGIGVMFLILVGIASFYLLFWSMGEDPFVFLRSNWKRGYLADPSIVEGGSALGTLFLSGVAFLPTASLTWLGMLGIQGRRPRIMWWGYTLLAMLLLLVVSPRAAVLGFVVSLLIVYHVLVTPLHAIHLVLIGAVGLVYAYAINLWRGITGSMRSFDLVAGVASLSDQVSVDGIAQFVGGSDLVDIRIFVLLADNYGRVLPLKYGATFLRALYQFVPRAIWPGKPYDLGLEIGQLAGTSSLSGLPPGFFGELYMNLHVFGVILGAFVLGMALACLYLRWIASGRNPIPGVLLYAVLAQRILLLPSSTFGNAIVAVLLPMLGVIIAVKLTELTAARAPVRLRTRLERER